MIYPKVKVGQELFLVPARRRARAPSPCVVTKVGRKYFEVEYGGDYKLSATFSLSDWSQKTDYSADFRLYETEEAYRQEVERAAWQTQFRHVFTAYRIPNFTLEQYKAAAFLLGIEPPDMEKEQGGKK